MNEIALLGDEAVAFGALHAGLGAAYGYPGTPSTEIMETLIAEHEKGGPLAAWCTNEKTALEAALGVSYAGKRSIVTMKHVGLNVASDPFMNAALLGINGGLVLAVADDPGMHSSQNEQDSRFYAMFAGVPCLEPRSQQEAYDMTIEAFDLSERLHVPVMLRLVTRLSHARAGVVLRSEKSSSSLGKAKDKTQWMLLPGFARRNYQSLIEKQNDMQSWSVAHASNKLEIENRDTSLAIITSGCGGNYYEENLDDLIAIRGKAPARLHIGTYPIPVESIRKLCKDAKELIIIEEGQPLIEEKIRGILEQSLVIKGKFDGTMPRAGELDPDNVRAGLGLPKRENQSIDIKLPGRPPQLCQGCPHGDSYTVIKKAAEGLDSVVITADIGCYALGAAPPYAVPETIVCMGASVGMAKGASDAGIEHAIGVIGDSTFLHSGMNPLIDAISANTPMTLAILDNSIVAMTGCQTTMIPSSQFKQLVIGLGVNPEHVIELDALPNKQEENITAFKKEMNYRGLSVVIFKRECIEAFRKRAKQNKAAKTTGGQA
jgi:indolepyruvate ferredoxin oxidoreductase alpha subunit